MQHYAIFLQNYNFDIRYRKSEQHANADCLSRLPVSNTDTFECDTIDQFQSQIFNTIPVTANQVAKATRKDKDLSQLLNHLKSGTHNPINSKYATTPFREFSLSNDVIFRGHRVVIPSVLQKRILNELHLGHFGVVRMKHLARDHVWWNKIDQDIEYLVKNCFDCNSCKNNQRFKPYLETYQNSFRTRTHRLRGSIFRA